MYVIYKPVQSQQRQRDANKWQHKIERELVSFTEFT